MAQPGRCDRARRTARSQLRFADHMRTSSAIGFGSDGGSPRSLDLATMRLESSATLRVVSRRVRSRLNAHPPGLRRRLIRTRGAGFHPGCDKRAGLLGAGRRPATKPRRPGPSDQVVGADMVVQLRDGLGKTIDAVWGANQSAANFAANNAQNGEAGVPRQVPMGTSPRPARPAREPPTPRRSNRCT